MNVEILIRLLLAILWGGIVGAEREYKSKSAGFRTMIMISLGSCFFTIMSLLIGDTTSRERIASNIVTGIGFLGAGVIFRGESRVNGITTAATIWAVAAVGMGIGAGYYFAAGGASILILIVLAFLPSMENMIDRINQSNEYRITCYYTEDAIANFEEMMRRHKLKFKIARQLKDGDELTIVCTAQGRSADHKQFIAELGRMKNVRKFGY